jgi:hypothetical protein
MKNLLLITGCLFMLSVIFISCEREKIEPEDSNILPENFRVEIPDALMTSPAKSLKKTNDAILGGNTVYFHLTTFIKAGDGAAKIVSDIISAIRTFNLSQPMSFTFQSADDNRAKNVKIIENSTFEDKTWQFQMNITDADSESKEDGGMAIQIFWNKKPVKGIAIIKPYNTNRNTTGAFTNSMVRIDYSEAKENQYEQEMTVYISGLALDNPVINPYSMQTLKMTAGKTGNTVKVFGNSNHPNAVIFSGTPGYNWAFVAAGSNVSKIGVAEVGLPKSTLNSSNRNTILVQHSLKSVFTSQIYATWPSISSELVNFYLQNTDAPGYFNHTGFVAAGTAPGQEYAPFATAIQTLVPYNPYEVSNLILSFKK